MPDKIRMRREDNGYRRGCKPKATLNFAPAALSLTLNAMKRNWLLLVFLPALLVGAGTAHHAVAQNTAAQAAEREEAEDRYKRLTAQVGELVANQALVQQQISALDKGLRDLREEIVRAHNNTSTQESLRRLAEQVQKVDETRVAENRKIHETLDDLHRLLKAAAAAPPPSRPSPTPAAATSSSQSGSATEEGFDYKVEKGDTLLGIVQAYRQQKIMVSAKAITDANPKVDWNRLKVGQKIFIPKPKG
jgi:TolA-binding protein